MLISKVEEIFLSTSYRKFEFTFNNRKLVLNKKTLSLVENFFLSVNCFIVGFNAVEIPISFPKSNLRGKLKLFFPIIEAVCTTTVVEIAFVFLQPFEPEKKGQKSFSAKLASFVLNFSKGSSAELLKCYIEDQEIDFFLPLLLTNECLERGNYKLNVNYNFEKVGFNRIRKNNCNFVLNFSQKVAKYLTFGNIFRKFIKSTNSFDFKCFLSTKVISKTDTQGLILLSKKKIFYLHFSWFRQTNATERFVFCVNFALFFRNFKRVCY